MRDRLIELIRDCCEFSHCQGNQDLEICKNQCDKTTTLADHLLANGVICPPCKVETLVHCIVFLPETGKLSIAKGFIKEITICEHEMNFHIVGCRGERYSNLNIWLTLDEIKRLAFWGENAEEEAEKALRGEGE